MMNSPLGPTVFVVDDYVPGRKSISRLLRTAGFAVTAFATAKEFLAQYDPKTPGCLVLDLAMPAGRGLELQSILAGKSSLLPRPVNDEDLLAAVRVAIEKDSALRREQAELSEIRARVARLTPREREVLEYVVAGKLNKQIAGELGTVEQTVKIHRAHVMQKMRVQSVAELVRLTQRCGISGR